MNRDKTKRSRAWPLGVKPVTLAKLAIGAALVIPIIAAVVAIVATAQPSFFSGYKAYARGYKSLQASAHRDLACVSCHAGRRSGAEFAAASVADFYTGIFKRPKEPAYAKMRTPSRDACLECHRYDWSDDASRTLRVPHPAHLRVVTEERDCVKCHKWVAHEEAYMERHKTMPFSGVCISFGCHVGAKPADSCKSCHHTAEGDSTAWVKAHPRAARAQGAGTCLEVCHEAKQCRLCHTTGKRPKIKGGFAVQAGFKAIQEGHTKPDWLTRHGGESLANPSRCQFCHVSVSECQDCHSRRPAFHGSTSTWLASHKKVSKDERRCLTCHEKAWCKDCHDKFKELR